MGKKMNDKISNALRVNLNRDLAEDLTEIKVFYGIQADSDMIRFLIREKKKELMKKADFQSLLDKKDRNT